MTSSDPYDLFLPKRELVFFSVHWKKNNLHFIVKNYHNWTC